MSYPKVCANPQCERRTPLRAFYADQSPDPVRVQCDECTANWNPKSGWWIPEAERRA